MKKRARAGCGVLGMRFTADPMVPAERFDRLRRELGDGFEAIEIDSGRGNPHGIARTAHSVVTNDLVDEAGHPTRAALDRVLGFFAERLRHGRERRTRVGLRDDRDHARGPPHLARARTGPTR